ncbi:MAG TPA: zf-HC2 domain-containing protein [Burkholderiales bacterium]|nr:zf-HC2 domain-containing protein [Burkholderiales bacterium]
MRLTCKEATALVSQGLDRRLSLWERCMLKIHLLVCDACRNFVRQADFIRRAVKRLADR